MGNTGSRHLKKRSALLLLKPRALEFEGVAILQDRSDGLCRNSARNIGLDLQRNADVGFAERGEMSDDLFHDLARVPGHHARVDFDGAVEAVLDVRGSGRDCWPAWLRSIHGASTTPIFDAIAGCSDPWLRVG